MRRGPFPPRKDLSTLGTDPDYRFSLANERTMLAYLRTSLALMAGGVALLQLFDRPLDTAAGVVLVLSGIAVAASSYPRWWRTEAALRIKSTLPISPMPAFLAIVLTIVGLLILFARAW